MINYKKLIAKESSTSTQQSRLSALAKYTKVLGTVEKYYVDDLNITIADYDEHFKKLAQYYQQEPEYTILNPDFIAYPLKSKEEVEEWITKMRKTHDIFYEKAGTIVFKRKDSENMLTK